MKKILVIDDEKDIRDNISGILKKHHYNVVTCGDLTEAKKQIAHHNWDAVICDVMIPHLGGFELAEAVKSAKRNTPVILVTGMDKEVLSATQTNADLILHKPFTGKQILHAVEKLIAESV